MSDQSEDPSPLHPPNTSNVLNFEYQVNFNEADGQITWTLPSGTPGLGAALAVKYPQIGTHRERMSVALAQYFTNNAKQSSPILHSESPTASQPLYTSQQRWVTDNDLVTAACAASKPPPISIQTLPTAALIQGYVDHSDASSRLSVVSTSKLKRKSNVRTRKLTEAGKEEARLNRVHHATCQHHSAAKTKCDARTCRHNKLYQQSQHQRDGDFTSPSLNLAPPLHGSHTSFLGHSSCQILDPSLDQMNQMHSTSSDN